MSIMPDYNPILEGSPNQDYQYNAQLETLYAAAANLSLTSRDGVIQNFDKAGNLSAQYLVFTSNAVANTEDAIPHSLNHIPRGYIVVRQDKASGGPYDSGTANTLSKLFLKSPVASVLWTLLVF